MKKLQAFALALVVGLPLAFTSCSDDDDVVKKEPGKFDPKEILLTHMDVSTDRYSNSSKGVYFAYNANGAVTQIIDYTLPTNSVAATDTTYLKKYVLDRSTANKAVVNVYWHDSNANKWNDTPAYTTTLTYSGNKITKIEQYDGMGVDVELAWDGDRVIRTKTSWNIQNDTLYYDNSGNRKDSEKLDPYTTSDSKYINKSIFMSTSNFYNMVPIEYTALASQNSFALDIFYSKNSMKSSNAVYEYINYTDATKKEKKTTNTTTTTADYSYTFGNLSKVYPTKVVKEYKEVAKTENHENPATVVPPTTKNWTEEIKYTFTKK